MYQFIVSIIFKLSAQGIEAMVDRLRDIPQVIDVMYLPQCKAFNVVASTPDCQVQLSAIEVASDMVDAIDVKAPVNITRSGHDSAKKSEYIDSMHLKRAINTNGIHQPLSEDEKTTLRHVLLPKKVCHKPFTAVWDKMLRRNALWRQTLGDLFKQFATVREGLDILSSETGTVLEVDAGMQVVYIGANSRQARDGVMSRLDTLATIPFGYARPINMVTPPATIFLCIRPLAMDGLTTKTFVNPGSRSVEDAYRDVYRAKRISPMLSEGKLGPKVWLLPQFSPPKTYGHLEARLFCCVAPDTRYSVLENALSRLSVSLSDKPVALEKQPMASNKRVTPRVSCGFSWAAATQKSAPAASGLSDLRSAWQVKDKAKLHADQGKQPLIATSDKFNPKSSATATMTSSNASSSGIVSSPGSEKRGVFLDPIDSSVEMEHEDSFYERLGGAGAAWLDRSVESHIYFMASLNATIRKMMSRVRLCPGDIRVSVVFGRMMVHDFNHDVLPLISDINTRIPLWVMEYGVAQVQSLLAIMNSPISGRQPRVDFTPIITTSVDDIRAFELNLGKTARFEFSSTSTYYDFSCCAGADDFIVSIKATKSLDTSLRFAPARSERCRLNAHCINNLFDFRVVVTVNDTTRLKRSYGAFAEWLRKSLEVKVDTCDPMKVSLVYPNVDEESLKITSVSVRGIHIFRDQSQTQNLEVRFTQPFTSSYIENGTKILALSPAMLSSGGSPVGMHSSGLPQQWYEISMYSSPIQSALRENRNLTFGKEPQWTAREVDADNIIGKFTEIAMTVSNSLDSLGHSGTTNGFERLQDDVEFEPWVPLGGEDPNAVYPMLLSTADSRPRRNTDTPRGGNNSGTRGGSRGAGSGTRGGGNGTRGRGGNTRGGGSGSGRSRGRNGG